MRLPRIAASALVAGMALAAEAATSAAVRAEVLHLLAYVESSQCAFYRNGKWHDPRTARRHLQRKYDYLAKRDLVRRTEDFLDLAATRSSVSGEGYRVRCQDSQPMSSGAWLGEELTRLRVQERARHR